MDINRINSMQVGMYRAENIQEKSAERLKKEKESSSSSSARGDKVDLSKNAQLRDIAHRTAQDALDIRQERVNQLKGTLDDGSYEVDVRKLASRLLFEDGAIFKA